MCGRFYLDTDPHRLLDQFEVEEILFDLDDIKPRYNIAPSQNILAIKQNPDTDKREACLLRWGLIPFWAKDKKIGYKMINARAETVAGKPAYRAAFKQRRCLIPASGFYEWKQENGKQPYSIRRKDRTPFAFAGLWEHWEKEEEIIESCTIVVKNANDTIRPIHDRMPVILAYESHNLWLNKESNTNEIQSLLETDSSHELEYYPVSKAVNSPKNNQPELINHID